MNGLNLLVLENDSFVSLTTDVSPTAAGIVSDKIVDVVTIINFGAMCSILFVFGTVSNIVNIIVFVRMGFKDATNISLFSLAVSDLGSCFSLFLFALCFNPEFKKLDLLFNPEDFTFFSGSVHAILARTTSIITAFITFERCLCVVAPLRVKEIFTAKRVTVFLVCSSLFVVGSYAIHFYTARYVWIFVPERNRSILVVEMIDNFQELEAIPIGIHSVFIPIVVFFVVVISTLVLIFSLRRKAKWRESVTKSTASLSARDAKVSKMVVTIAILFIVCYIPVFVSYIVMIVEPEYNIGRKYHNLLLVMFSFHFTLESINSSLNIFIYYRMSSAYRAVFLELFGKKTSTERSS